MKQMLKETSKRLKAEYVCTIHSHVPFCRSAAVVKVTNGVCRLTISRDLHGANVKEGTVGLLIDDRLAVMADVCDYEHNQISNPGNIHLGSALLTPSDFKLLAKGYSGIENEAKRILPLVGQLGDGYYVVAEFEQFPCVKHSGQDSTFTDFLLGSSDPCSDPYDGAVNFRDKYSTYFGYECGGFHSVPLFLWGTLKPESLDWSRVEFYMAAMRERENTLPHPIALYLSGAVSLVVDGYHRIAAAAMLGKSIRCTLVFKVEDGDRIARCIQDGEPLFLNTHGRYYHVAKKPDGTRPLVFSHDEWDRGVPFIADKRDMIVSPMVCLETAHASLMTEEEAHCLRMGWMQEGVSGCSCTASKNDFVSNYHPKPYHVPMRVLNIGTNLHIGHLKETLDAVMGLNNGRYEHGISEEEKTDTYVSADWHAPMSNALIAYHELFPESKWVSDSDADALRRGEQQNEWCEYYRYEHPMIGDYILNRVMGKIQGLPTAMKCCLWDVVGYLQGEGSIEEFIDTFRNDMSLLMHIIGRNGREIYERLYPHELAFVHELETLYLKPYKRSERPALDSKLVQLVSEYAEKEFDRKEFITN